MSDFTVSRIAVFTIWAEDVSKAVHFYRDVLGLAELPDHSSRPTLKLSDAFLVILRGTPHAATNTEMARYPLFALAVDDLDQAVAHLRAHNCALTEEIQHHGASSWIMFHDPAGNLIELVQDHS